MKNALHHLRPAAVALLILLGAAAPATAQLSIGISQPGLSIGINLPVYPEFVRVPNYPVYYAPRLQSNYFFYDGMYWVYQQDDWYASNWYNGPWYAVAPQAVPLFVLRIPVRYYRNPPAYFRGWQRDAPPRWGDHWGNDWSRQHSGWDRWDRRAVPSPAPLPTYQRQYSGDRYPRVEQQQQQLHSRNYRYQPREDVVRQHAPQRSPPAAPQRAPQAVDTRDRAPPPGRAEAPRHDQSQQQGPGRAREADRGNGKAKGKDKDKDKDKDRGNNDESGQQRKKP